MNVPERIVLSYFGILLSYKIESPVPAPSDADVRFSTNVFTDGPKDLGAFEVDLEEAKLGYLQSEKEGVLKRLGVLGAPKTTIEELINRKLTSNYIYSMSYSDQFEVAKFNMMLELDPLDGGEPVRTLAALEYQPASERLRVITFY
jgi:hypothetical protein